ncbi:MAG: hypothetical protein B7X50_00465 [Alishewanella sp. 34-51-39]|nr:MAG: hypothetical protein B7X50_00465 [Alishewanella sp. 34-51-39]
MRLTFWFFVIGISLSLPAMANCSFRLDDGKLLRCGMPGIEVLDRLGQPLLKEQVTLGVSTNSVERGQTVEVWSYKTRADMGGEFLLSIEFTDGKVSNISRKQRGRL